VKQIAYKNYVWETSSLQTIYSQYSKKIHLKVLSLFINLFILKK